MLRNQPLTELKNQEKPRKQQYYLAKSSSMASVLQGNIEQPLNNHYIDSLQRFKKDFAVYDKEQRQKQRDRKLRNLQERKNQQIQRQSRVRQNQFEYDQRNMEKINQSRFLCQIGLKKTGFSNGMPMNPITLQYHSNPFGSQQKYTDQQEKLRRMVRAHHLQNASTCGYNLINGSNLPSLDPLVPKNTQGRFQQKLGHFYQSKKLNPNVDLGLNPKNNLPKYVGQNERGNNSPIKSQKWQEENQMPFQSSYKSHFNQRPYQQLTNSRMQQSNIYKKYLPEGTKVGDGSMHMPKVMYGQTVQTYSNKNNENTNVYMQDTAFQNQLYEMRK